ncbi:MAG: hypothetical protein DRJ66_02945 [Thermoprotei archaeon]|nr:MAG: hypothetical protein DRJ66_02945 [Thermoprotei archaeon]
MEEIKKRPITVMKLPVNILKTIFMPWEDVLIGPKELGGDGLWIKGYGIRWIGTRLRLVSELYKIDNRICYWEIPYYVIENAYLKDRIFYYKIVLTYGRHMLEFRVSRLVKKVKILELIKSVIAIPVDSLKATTFWKELSKEGLRAVCIGL